MRKMGKKMSLINQHYTKQSKQSKQAKHNQNIKQSKHYTNNIYAITKSIQTIIITPPLHLAFILDIYQLLFGACQKTLFELQLRRNALLKAICRGWSHI